MQALVLALYAEGTTDEHFLPPIIQRTAEVVIAARGRTTVDVLDPWVVKVEPGLNERATCILAAARQTEGFHALIIHADADHPTPERALHERIQPGMDRVTAAGVRHTLIPLIPVRMTEAWLLADPEALLHVIGTNMTATALGLPEREHLVESDPDPRQTLHRVVRDATALRRRRRRQFHADELYAPLARIINLERLCKVPSYQQFVEDFTVALKSLSFLE